MESYYAQIRMKISPGIQLCTGMSSYLLLNTNFIFQQRKNCGLKLRHRKRCSIYKKIIKNKKL